MTSLGALREAHARRLEAAVRAIVARLSPLPQVRRISLFGSYARGRADLLTDLDVLVVVETDLGPVERLRWLYELLAVPVDLDLLCYTPEEYERMRDEPFLRHALASERVLFERPAPVC